MNKAPSHARFIAHALMVFAAVSCSVEAGSPLVDDHQQGTFISLNLRPVHTVCWRNSTPESQPYERIVQDVIEREYNAKTEAKFLGWKPCSGTDLSVPNQLRDPRAKEALRRKSSIARVWSCPWADA
jgi:hypothetical protein